MKKFKKLVSMVSALTLSISLIPSTMMQTTVFADNTPQAETLPEGVNKVELINDDFSNYTTGADVSAKWTRNEDGNGTKWTIANGMMSISNSQKASTLIGMKRTFDTSSIPASKYDLKIKYKAKSSVTATKDEYLLGVLGSTAEGKKARTVSFNGSEYCEELTGIYYSATDGKGQALYTTGYDAANWYTIEIIAHIDGTNSATYDYNVYNEDESVLLAQKNDQAGGLEGVKKPDYFMFYRLGATNVYVDDLQISAYYTTEEVLPEGTEKVELIKDDFSNYATGADVSAKWTRNEDGNGTKWTIANGMMSISNSQKASTLIGMKRSFDTSSIPATKYDLKIKYKAKSSATDTKDEYLLGVLGSTAEGKKARTISFNGSAYGEELTGIYYSKNDGKGQSLYTTGYGDEGWYVIDITAHVNGTSEVTYDYKVYDKNETVVLAEVENVAGGMESVINPDYFMFYRLGATQVYVDDLQIDAYYSTTEEEVLPEGVHKVELIKDDFSNYATGADVNAKWTRNEDGNGTKWTIASGMMSISNSQKASTLIGMKRSFDTSSVPATKYDLKIKYKAKSSVTDTKDEYLLGVIGSSTKDTRAATVSFNGSQFGEELTGIYYTKNDGKGIALYTDGYDQTQWYTIEITAHVNGISAADYDYKVYDANGVLKGQVENVGGGVNNNKDLVVTPDYFMFYRLGATNVYVDDLEISAYYKDTEYVNGYEKISLVEESFSDARLFVDNPTIWERNVGDDDYKWAVINGRLTPNKNGSGIIAAKRNLDTSELPEKYELVVKYKTQVSAFDDVKDEYLVTYIGSDPVKDTAGNTKKIQAATVSINGTPWASEKTGFNRVTNGEGVTFYSTKDGYNPTQWYTVEIKAHIDGLKAADFDYTIYSNDGLTKLAEVKNVYPQNGVGGYVVNPTYVMFQRVASADKVNTTLIDDLEIYALCPLNQVASVNVVKDNGEKTELEDNIDKGFKQFEINCTEKIGEATTVVTLKKGAETVAVNKTVTGNVISISTADYLDGQYTLSVKIGEHSEFEKTFTVNHVDDLIIKDFAWYKGAEKITDYTDLDDGENALTLKAKVLNLTGEAKNVVIGYGTYLKKYLENSNFAKKSIADNTEETIEINATITKKDFDKVSGFLWDAQTNSIAYSRPAILD